MVGRRTSENRGFNKDGATESPNIKRTNTFIPEKNMSAAMMTGQTITKNAYGGLSEYRRGVFDSQSGANGSDLTKWGQVALVHSGGFDKTASAATTGGHGGANVTRMAPEVYSPLYQVANLNLPRDRVTTNAWARNYFITHPVVRNSIQLHSTYPISKLNIKCKDKEVEQFFNDMIHKINLMQIISDAALDYWLLGEAFVYMEIDEDEGVWSRGVVHNPDYCVLSDTYITMGDGSQKQIKDVRPNDKVLTDKGNSKKVSRLLKKWHDGSIYNISTSGMYDLNITGNHDILIGDPSKEPTWTRADNVNPGDYLVFPRPKFEEKDLHIDLYKHANQDQIGHNEEYIWSLKVNESQDFKDAINKVSKQTGASESTVKTVITQEYMHGYKKCHKQKTKLEMREDIYRAYKATGAKSPKDAYAPRFLDIDEDLAFIIGLYLAKGSVHKNYLRFCFSSDEMNHVKFIEKYFKQFGINSYIINLKETRDKNAIEIDVMSALFADVFKSLFNTGSKSKKIPENFIHLKRNIKSELLQGAILGDGCVSNYTRRDGLRYTNRVRFSSTNHNLCSQIQYLMSSVGYYTRIVKTKRMVKFKGSDKEYNNVMHNIDYCGDQINDMSEDFPKLNIVIHKKTQQHRKKYLKDDNRFYFKIDEIRAEPYSGEVYNLDVEDDHTYVASQITVHNCHVKKSTVGEDAVISLRPDAVLMRVATSNDPMDMEIRKRIPDKVLYHIRKGETIPLDNFNVSHLKMSASPSDVRGTPLVASAFKDLMLYDKLRESKFAQADSMINPITHVKVGGAGEGADYHPNNADLEQWRQILEEAQYDKDYKIISHHGVEIVKVTNSGQVIDIQNDLERIISNIHIGLMTPKALIETESANYSSSSIGLEVLRERYNNFRNMMSRWLTDKIFAPICEIQGFYEYGHGTKKLIVPEIDWNHMNLYDMDSYIQVTSQMLADQNVSLRTVYRSLGLDYEDEMRKVREEQIRKKILEKELAVIDQMKLSQIRSLDLDQPIIELSVDEMAAALPGVGGEEGGDMGMDMGMDMGGGEGGGDMGMDMGGGGEEAAPDMGGEAPDMGGGEPAI